VCTDKKLTYYHIACFGAVFIPESYQSVLTFLFFLNSSWFNFF
jgi:hypothetical protein